MPPDHEKTAAQLRCPHGEAAAETGRMMNLRNLAQIAACLETFQPRVGEKLLEIGCGDGGLLGFVLSRAENLRYCGAEISAAMYEAAVEFNQAFIGAGLADYRLYDGLKLPADDAAFDAVFSVNTVYFWQDAAAMLEECARVLKPQGRLCLSFCEKPFMRKLPFAQYGFTLYDAADLRALAAGAWTARETRRTDWAVSKNGALVERETVHLLLEKQ